MKNSDLVRLAFTFMARRKTRTFLTILGVITGTVCIILMLSAGLSGYEQFRSAQDSSALTQIQVMSENADITSADISQIAALPGVRAASPILRLPGTLYVGSYESSGDLKGIDGEVLDLRFAQGELFEPGSQSPSLVLEGDAVRNFIDPDNPPELNDYASWEAYAPDVSWLNTDVFFQFGSETPEDAAEEASPSWLAPARLSMQVSGVTEQGANHDGTNIYISIDAARRILMENVEKAEKMGIPLNGYSEALVRTNSMDSVEEVLTQLRDMGFDAYSDVEYVRETRDEQNRQLLQLLLTGLVSLFVSAIGIANTMYAGVLERRKDIGVLKVLGVTSGQIERLFLFEAAASGLAGGLAGAAASYFIVFVLNTGLSSGNFPGMELAQGTGISIPLWVSCGAVAVAGITGMAAGLKPASKAARMSSLDAMRT